MAELINFTHSPELESVRIKRRKLDSESTSEVCTHPGSFGDMCIRCGQKLDGESGVTFAYIHKGLRLHHHEISRLRNTDSNKKLNLMLDLDHTIKFHSSCSFELSRVAFNFPARFSWR
ncbi:hypothetical protein HN51_024214 [Arachis hypogaea]|uniref:protein-serine/threonine phosphatase n=1 Tax=Arachis hypogaea TaxID=3818 RepID=A0A445C529_ARAHY|nr:hypothetical protein Ahy_A07g031811 [Arachis hypogaea]